jgi:peroxiredoxin
MESMRALLQELHSWRIAHWRPEDLEVNVQQRRTLVEGAAQAKFPSVGDTVPMFELPVAGGGTFSLADTLDRGAVVLIFFRFAGCPACNLALPYYQRQLAGPLRALGAQLAAVSPQLPERLLEIKARHSLEFTVASDLDNRLGRHFGILYSYDEASRQASLARGAPIGEVTGTGSWELPMPAVIVIDRDRIVRFVEVSPDWLVRTEAQPIIAAVRALQPYEQRKVANDR